MTFHEIEQQWQQAKTLEVHRELWENLRGASQGWLKACQAAVSERDLQTIEQWLEAAARIGSAPRREPTDGSKESCLKFANGVYAPVAHAYLLCARAIIQTRRMGDASLVLDHTLQVLAEQMPTLAWPLNQWRDVVHILHPIGTRAPALYSV